MAYEWRLNELDFAGAEHLDVDYVRGYEAKAQYDPAADVAALLQLSLNRKSTVIDLGAGTGSFSLAVAPHCRQVYAVDPSPVMCAFLKQRLAEAQIQNVSVVQASFLTFDTNGKCADFIFTRNALHHLPDFWKAQALKRMYANLSPDGFIRICDLFYDFDPKDSEAKIHDWLQGAVTNPTEGYTAPEFVAHLREEFSTFSWIFELMLEKTGFQIESKQFHKSIYGTYVCSKSAVVDTEVTS